MIDKIPLLKIPKHCACCRKETRNQRPSKAEGRYRKCCACIYFRLSDFSYWLCEFCVDCALQVEPKHYYDLEAQTLRSDVVEWLCAKVRQKNEYLFDSGGNRWGVLHEADTNWEKFVDRNFPLDVDDKEKLLRGMTNLRVFWERAGDGWKGVRKSRGWPFPILGIVRYMKPTEDLLDVEVCTREDLEKIRHEQS